MTEVPYIPHGWVVGWQGDTLRVFCSWSGGYLDGDSWRLNSGVRTVRVDEGNYIINEGGSEYLLGLHNYGRISAYNGGTLSKFEEAGFDVLTHDEAVTALEVIGMFERARRLVEYVDVDLDEPLDPKDD